MVQADNDAGDEANGADDRQTRYAWRFRQHYRQWTDTHLLTGMLIAGPMVLLSLWTAATMRMRRQLLASLRRTTALCKTGSGRGFLCRLVRHFMSVLEQTLCRLMVPSLEAHQVVSVQVARRKSCKTCRRCMPRCCAMTMAASPMGTAYSLCKRQSLMPTLDTMTPLRLCTTERASHQRADAATVLCSERRMSAYWTHAKSRGCAGGTSLQYQMKTTRMMRQAIHTCCRLLTRWLLKVRTSFSAPCRCSHGRTPAARKALGTTRSLRASCIACSRSAGSSRAGHEKLVTALDVDRAGARALTGGEDYHLRMFDFGGMKRDMRAFRKLEPSDGYPVNAVSFSPTGERPCLCAMAE